MRPSLLLDIHQFTGPCDISKGLAFKFNHQFCGSIGFDIFWNTHGVLAETVSAIFQSYRFVRFVSRTQIACKTVGFLVAHCRPELCS